MLACAIVGLAGVLVWVPADLSPGPRAARDTDDKVDILEPADEAYFADVPTAVTIVVEVTNNSPLEIQEVYLDVDAQRQEMFCASAGQCEWTVELDEGVHELRSVVVRNIGGPLLSQFVQVQVGGEPPGADATTAPGDADGSTGTEAAAASDTGDRTGASTGATPGGETDSDGDGCSCRAQTALGSTAGWLALFGLLSLRRRRALQP